MVANLLFIRRIVAPTSGWPPLWHRGHLALLLLLACCGGGCAQRNISFVSDPPGATVSYDSQQCVTPCRLKSDCAAGKAQLSHPLAGEQVVVVDDCKVGDTIRYHALGTTAVAFKVAAVPFAVLGIIGLGVISDDADNGDSTHPDVWLITGGSLLTAGVLYGCGEGFGRLKGDLDTEVFVTFPPTHSRADRQGDPPATPPRVTPDRQELPDPLQLNEQGYQRLFSQPAAP